MKTRKSAPSRPESEALQCVTNAIEHGRQMGRDADPWLRRTTHDSAVVLVGLVQAALEWWVKPSPAWPVPQHGENLGQWRLPRSDSGASVSRADERPALSAVEALIALGLCENPVDQNGLPIAGNLVATRRGDAVASLYKSGAIQPVPDFNVAPVEPRSEIDVLVRVADKAAETEAIRLSIDAMKQGADYEEVNRRIGLAVLSEPEMSWCNHSGNAISVAVKFLDMWISDWRRALHGADPRVPKLVGFSVSADVMAGAVLRRPVFIGSIRPTQTDFDVLGTALARLKLRLGKTIRARAGAPESLPKKPGMRDGGSSSPEDPPTGSGRADRDQRPERLRLLADEITVEIKADPAAYEEPAKWFLELPLPPISAAREMEADGSVDWNAPLPNLSEEEASTRVGPTFRRLMNAWHAATERFSRRTNDRFYDLSMTDAKRITLLTALTYNVDFDGHELGLPAMPWTTTPMRRLDGREPVRVGIEDWSEQTHLDLINKSILKLRVAKKSRGGSDDAKPLAMPVVADAIDEEDAALLAFLNRNPGMRRKVSDVQPDIGPGDRKAIAKRLRRLADRVPALVEYPRRKHGKVAILPAGIEILKRVTALKPQ